MNKKSKKLITVFFLTLVILILTSCGVSKKQVKQMDELHPGDEYQFVYEQGISKNNEHFSFRDLVAKEIKNYDKRVSNQWFDSDLCYIIGDRLFFLYRYNKSGQYPNDRYKYASGYIDLLSMEVKIFKFYDNLEIQEIVRITKFGNKVAYFDSEFCTVYDSDALTETNINLNGYTYENTFEKEGLLVIRKDFDDFSHFRVIDINLKEIEFPLEKRSSLTYFKFPYVYYYRDIYKCLDLTTFSFIDPNTVRDLLFNKDSDFDFIINGNKYTYKIQNRINDDYESSKRGYLILESDDYERIISIDEIREAVPEVLKVEEIFRRQIYFVDVSCFNDELFLILQYDQSFFGFYGGQSVPIVIKYDIENHKFKYVGYYGTIYGDLIKVYKLK